MKRYLMRGGQAPIDAKTPKMITERNTIGNNSGNLLYLFGVYRTLLREDVTIDMDLYQAEKVLYSDKDIDEINEKYDAYICPLADAFRDDFNGKLGNYARFFSKLKIPVYVIGMGLRAPSFDDITNLKFVFDENAKKFVKAVTNKGSMLGLRGEITGSYLHKLGFTEGTDYQAIGCPSMYSFGRQLNMRQNVKFTENGVLSPDTRLVYNLSSKTPEQVVKFLIEQGNRFPEHYATNQAYDEMLLLHYGIEFNPSQPIDRDIFPWNVDHELIRSDRYKMFINAKPWFDFMKTMDLSIGCKLHGNVAAVISGCPAIFMPIDGRMIELINMHQFPHIAVADLKPNDTIESVMERVDMKSYIDAQPRNFDRFISFLHKNKLPTIYDEDMNLTEAPLDKQMSTIEYPLVTNILHCDRAEMIARNNELMASMDAKVRELKSKVSELKTKIGALKKK